MTRWRPLVPVIALVAGLMLATSAAESSGTDLRAGRRTELADLIAAEQRRVARYDAQARRLRAAVTAATRAEAVRNAPVAAARTAADRLAAPAGLVPVAGPGLTVTLDDAPRPPPGQPLAGNPSPDDLVVHQQDVQAVVNAMWAAGAEAMTIMGQRVVSTTAVRCVGNTLLLQGAVYSPPFVVTAVGSAAQMRRALNAEPGVRLFREYVAAYGLGYTERSLDRVRMPAYAGSLELPHVALPARQVSR